MGTPRQRVEKEVRQALKAGEKSKLSTLRMLLNAIDNERIRTGREVDESTLHQLVRKAIKQREEASEQYRRGGRHDLADREQWEADFLTSYLPPPASESDIRQAIREYLSTEGLSGQQAIGPVMKEMISRFGGAADGATINRLAREVLAEQA